MPHKIDHVHKYRKMNIAVKPGKKYFVYQCVLDCSHYVPEKLINGKKSLCWKCNKEFIIKNPNQVKLKCADCSTNKEINDEELDKIKNILKNVGVI